jgi:hypothetical protein
MRRIFLVDKEILNRMTKALDTAKEKLNQASYLSECGSNPGLRQMNSNKADWLHWVVYLAEHGLETLEEEERLAAEQDKPQKDETIDEQSNKVYELKSDFQRVMDFFQAVNSIKL